MKIDKKTSSRIAVAGIIWYKAASLYQDYVSSPDYKYIKFDEKHETLISECETAQQRLRIVIFDASKENEEIRKYCGKN